MSIAMAEAPASTQSILSQSQVMELERQYLLQNYGRYPLMLVRGKGCNLYDADGKRYLDLISGIGVNSLGYNHPRITKVIREQAALLLHTSNLYYHPYQGALAKRLCEASGLQRVFYCNSGTEGVEAAVKMMHSHGRKISPQKHRMIALQDSFHGRTMGALSLTGQEKYRKDFEPLLPGVDFIRRNDDIALERVFNENTAGIIVEVVQGEGGINPVCGSFLRQARELCDRFNALLVFDEIQCGVGRPGTYFAYQSFSPAIMPDVLVMAKPVSCGLPMGAVITNERAAASIAPGMHGTTFGGGPLVCRVALEFFDILDELMPALIRTGDYFRAELRRLATRFSFIEQVRGKGLMIGVELDIPGKDLVLRGMDEGLLFNCTHDTVLRFLPPYILTEKDVDRAIRGLTKIFRKV
jgi:acetylornithine/N-succinyldiaminopimelate aminotransferase